MTRFGEFELLKKIAEGGMAEIYLARQAENEGISRTIVVKRMLPELSVRKDFVEMFLDEGRLAANIAHPNVVQVFNLGKVDNTYFMAMELVDGPHLGALFAHSLRTRRPLPVPFCVHAIARAADGLHFAHELRDNQTGQKLNIVHRDISPQNILVSKYGDVKVTDFGVAKASTQEAKTRTGVIKGKVSYMSPEQCLGEDLDRRTDLFALGVCLYELITRRRLFREKSDLLAMQRITAEAFKAPSEMNPAEVDAELDSILQKALEKDRSRRYESAADFSEALDIWLVVNGHGDCHGKLSRWMAEFAPDLGVGDANQASGSVPALTPMHGAVSKEHGSQVSETAPLLPDVKADLDAFDQNAPDTVSTPALIQTLGAEQELTKTETVEYAAPAVFQQDGQIRPKADGQPVEFKIGAYPDDEDYATTLQKNEPTVAVNKSVVSLKKRFFKGWGLAAAALVLVLGVLGAGILFLQEAEPARPKGTFAVLFESVPTGALLEVNGDERGITPIELYMPKGKVQVQVRFAEAGRKTQLEFEVQKDEKAVLLAPSKMMLSVQPKDAKVEIDGQKAEPVGYKNLWLSIGEHEIRVQKVGMKTEVKKIAVQVGKPEKLHFVLQPLTENELLAQNENVHLGAEVKKERPYREDKGGHRKIRKKSGVQGRKIRDKHAVADRNAVDNPKKKKRAQREAGKARLTVHARPWVNVRLRNQKLGATPVVDASVSSGRVLLRLDNDAAALHITTYVTLKKNSSGLLNLTFEKKNGKWKIASRRFKESF